MRKASRLFLLFMFVLSACQTQKAQLISVPSVLPDDAVPQAGFSYGGPLNGPGIEEGALLAQDQGLKWLMGESVKDDANGKVYMHYTVGAPGVNSSFDILANVCYRIRNKTFRMIFTRDDNYKGPGHTYIYAKYVPCQ